MNKQELIKFMNCCDFQIDDIKYQYGIEMIATKKIDSDELWWRPICVEGSGFNRLFKGTIALACNDIHD